MIHLKKHTTQNLRSNLKRKGIDITGTSANFFETLNYYQIVNAYKPLFINQSLKLVDINDLCVNDKDFICNRYDLKSSKYCSKNDLYEKVCDLIIEKYKQNYDLKGLKKQSYSNRIVEKELIINEKIDYRLHTYKGAKLIDFRRIFDLEHELRSVYLKNVLLIENNIKSAFISYLNDCKTVTSNFLTDINNYNPNDSYSFKSLSIVISKIQNNKSNPIAEKNSQEIIPPYWIIANELYLREVVLLINNLKVEHKIGIYNRICNLFALRVPGSFRNEKKKKQFYDALFRMLNNIAHFRNSLAHNNPLFLFNISSKHLKDSCVITNTRVEQVKNGIDYKYTESAIKYLENFFGRDSYNSTTNNKDINLAYITYVISKLLYSQKKNTVFKNDLIKTFCSYNVIPNLFYNKCEYNVAEIDSLLNKVLNIDIIDDSIIDERIEHIKEAVETGIPYRKLLAEIKRDFKEINNEMKKLKKKKIINNSNCYDLFPYHQKYREYTGIHESFINNL